MKPRDPWKVSTPAQRNAASDVYLDAALEGLKQAAEQLELDFPEQRPEALQKLVWHAQRYKSAAMRRRKR